VCTVPKVDQKRCIGGEKVSSLRRQRGEEATHTIEMDMLDRTPMLERYLT